MRIALTQRPIRTGLARVSTRPSDLPWLYRSVVCGRGRDAVIPGDARKEGGQVWLPPKKKPRVTALQDDLWVSRGRFGTNARWFAVSTVAHLLLLSVFATTAVTVIQKGQDLIKVTALPFAEDPAAQAADQQDPDWEEGGEPSLRDLPGVLSMDMLPHKRVKNGRPTRHRWPAAWPPSSRPPCRF